MSDNTLPAAFVTFGWCRSTYTVVRSLGARGVKVHVGDSSSLAMSRFSRFASTFTRLPDFYSEPENYVLTLSKAMKSVGAQVLLPCFEDVQTVLQHRELLAPDIKVGLPTLKDWADAEDKLDYIEIVERAGCPVPRTIKVSNRDEFDAHKKDLGFPIVVKARSGHGARGVEICSTERDLEETFFRLIETYELPATRWPILQQYLNGRKFKLDGVFENGSPAGSCVFEILRCKGAAKFGTSTFRKTVDAPDVVAYANAALGALNWHGMFNTDWICDANGVPHLIDINGRLSGAVGVCYEGGVDLPWQWYQVSAGLGPIIKETAIPDTYVRWILGDCIALVEQLGGGNFGEITSILKPKIGCRHDDFVLRDPLPFFAQFIDYFQKFIRSRGSLRPVSKEMVH